MLELCDGQIEVQAQLLEKEGIKLCQKVKPDIVLMDINMPDMGIGCHKYINMQYTDLGVIIMSVQSEKVFEKSYVFRRQKYLVKHFC